MDPFQPAEVRRLVGEFGSPLLILDCERLRVQWRQLRRALPGVDLYYALKPMPHPAVIGTVLAEGGGLDLATSGEVQLAAQLGAPAARCIHTHPIKRAADIANALASGLRTFVADNPDELAKLARCRAPVELLLRVAFRAPDAMCDLSRKFGCDPEAALALARRAATLGLRVRGFSFHVGSQVGDARMHVAALEACARLLGAARRERLGPCDTLDIGGGFPIDYLGKQVRDIQAFCAPLRAACRRLPRRVRVIAEPGRFVVGPAVLGVATVIGRARRAGRWWYYLDDGVYGSYNGQLYDHARYPLAALRAGGPRTPAVLAGPTCDSIDVIAEDVALPLQKAGDLILARNMGAYTWSSATRFNSYPRTTVVTVNRLPGQGAEVSGVS
ncbi:MAG: type III PLP-dependent enzyme [Gammaproteobacteria bacterium]|nr:type III PLP-dependent enzyme [Gammaproteobacteria bacterium]